MGILLKYTFDLNSPNVEKYVGLLKRAEENGFVVMVKLASGSDGSEWLAMPEPSGAVYNLSQSGIVLAGPPKELNKPFTYSGKGEIKLLPYQHDQAAYEKFTRGLEAAGYNKRFIQQELGKYLARARNTFIPVTLPDGKTTDIHFRGSGISHLVHNAGSNLDVAGQLGRPDLILTPENYVGEANDGFNLDGTPWMERTKDGKWEQHKHEDDSIPAWMYFALNGRANAEGKFPVFGVARRAKPTKFDAAYSVSRIKLGSDDLEQKVIGAFAALLGSQ